MADSEQLIEYFKSVKIRIELLKKYNCYGFRLRSDSVRYDYGFCFSSRKAAAYDALEIAFRLHQQMILRQMKQRREQRSLRAKNPNGINFRKRHG